MYTSIRLFLMGILLSGCSPHSNYDDLVNKHSELETRLISMLNDVQDQRSKYEDLQKANRELRATVETLTATAASEANRVSDLDRTVTEQKRHIASLANERDSMHQLIEQKTTYIAAQDLIDVGDLHSAMQSYIDFVTTYTNSEYRTKAMAKGRRLQEHLQSAPPVHSVARERQRAHEEDVERARRLRSGPNTTRKWPFTMNRCSDITRIGTQEAIIIREDITGQR